MIPHPGASKIALLFVLLIVGGSFVWWARSRPSYLLYQAHSEIGQKNQAAVIARYKRLLSKGNLDPDEEARLRLALGEFYVEASGEVGTVVIKRQDESLDVEHPFLAAAKKEFDRVLALEPENAQAHLNLGRLFLMKGLESFAIEELELATQYEPRFAAPLAFLALIKKNREKPEEARDLALQALSMDPSYDRARWALVGAYSALGEHSRAQAEYERLSPSFREQPSVQAPFALELARQNRWAKAEVEIQSALQRDPENLWVLLKAGQILMEKGEHEKATGVLMQAGSLYKRSAEIIVRLAEAHAHRGACGRVNTAAQILLRGLPRWPSSHLVKAWHEQCVGREATALFELDEALRLAPQFREAIQMKADILVDKGEYEKLGVLIRPLLDQKVNQALAYTLLAQSLTHQGKYELAKDTAQSAIQLNLQNPWPYIWLALSRAETGETAAAERAFQNALNLNPYNPRLTAYYAYFKARSDPSLVAKSLIQNAILKDQRDPILWLLRGKIHWWLNEKPEAMQALQQAISLRPYLLEAYLGLIQANWDRGNKKAADAYLSDALKINSKNKAVLKWRNIIRPS